MLKVSDVHAYYGQSHVLQGVSLEVGKGEVAVLRQHELLARHEIEQIEHFLIQHLPGADLLLDHVVAGLF